MAMGFMKNKAKGRETMAEEKAEGHFGKGPMNAPGLAKKGKIPPGLAKKGGIPPGLAKKAPGAAAAMKTMKKGGKVRGGGAATRGLKFGKNG